MREDDLLYEQLRQARDKYFNTLHKNIKDPDNPFVRTAREEMDAAYKKYTSFVDSNLHKPRNAEQVRKQIAGFTEAAKKAPKKTINAAHIEETIQSRIENVGQTVGSETVKNNLKAEAHVASKIAKGEKAFNVMSKGAKGFMIGGGILLGLGTIAHFANKAGDKAREEHQKAELARRQQENDKRAQKYRWAGTEMDLSPGVGQTVIDAFNKRQGHYKMGNSRFQ